MLRTILVLLLVAIAVPSCAQSTTLSDLLSGNPYPLALKLKDLDSQWRRAEVWPQGSEMGAYLQLAAGTGIGPATRYYTKGITATVGSETYIIAYAPGRKPLDPSSILRSSRQPPAPETLTADTVLQLSLLNIRTAGNLTDIRAFDMDAEIRETAGTRDAAKDSAAQATPGKKGFVTTKSGLRYKDKMVGHGAEAKAGEMVTVHYKGWLDNGKVFDSSRTRGEPFAFPLGQGQVIKGWDEGVAGMRVGGVRELTIPPGLGYGDRDVGKIPANSTLHFEVELLKVGVARLRTRMRP